MCIVRPTPPQCIARTFDNVLTQIFAAAQPGVTIVIDRRGVACIDLFVMVGIVSWGAELYQTYGCGVRLKFDEASAGASFLGLGC